MFAGSPASLKASVVGMLYRPLSLDSQCSGNYLCEMIEKASDVNREIYFLRDF